MFTVFCAGLALPAVALKLRLVGEATIEGGTGAAAT
jgi:hypothetical protein